MVKSIFFIHTATCLAWGAVLCVLAINRPRDAHSNGRRLRSRIYRYLSVPLLFLTAVSGVWILHKEPALLENKSVMIRACLFAGLTACDFLVQRCLDEAKGRRTRLAVVVALLTLMTLLVRP